MTRRILKAAKCSQMSNPTQGTGTGGDRCTEAVAAMIYDSYHLGSGAGIPAQHDTEQVMYWFTQMLNKGSNVSSLEDVSWIAQWFNHHSNGQVTLSLKLNPTYADIQAVIDSKHVAVAAFGNYAQLRLVSGSNPYSWTDPSVIGHVVLVVGYDDQKQSVIVHDPLRGTANGQPADYSFQSFQNAQFFSLSPVNGGALSGAFSLGTVTDLMFSGLAPDASVSDFLTKLDVAEKLQDPFVAATATAKQDNIGPVSFTDPVSWAGAVLTNTWNNAFALAFRAIIVGIGIFLLIRIVMSLVPQPSSEQVATVAQGAAMLA